MRNHSGFVWPLDQDLLVKAYNFRTMGVLLHFHA